MDPMTEEAIAGCGYKQVTFLECYCGRNLAITTLGSVKPNKNHGKWPIARWQGTVPTCVSSIIPSTESFCRQAEVAFICPGLMYHIHPPSSSNTNKKQKKTSKSDPVKETIHHSSCNLLHLPVHNIALNVETMLYHVGHCYLAATPRPVAT